MEIIITVVTALLIINTICLLWIIIHIHNVSILILNNQEAILELLEIILKNKRT